MSDPALEPTPEPRGRRRTNRVDRAKRILLTIAFASVVPNADWPALGSEVERSTGLDCESAAGAACAGGEVYDDGVPEGGFGWSDVVEDGIYVQKFSPPEPAGLYHEICICWMRGTSGPQIDFRLVAFDDDGVGGGPGTRILDRPATATSVPFPREGGAFYSYALGNDAFLVPAGGVWIGAEWNATEELGFGICTDDSLTTPQQEILASNDGGASWFDLVFQTSSLLLRARRLAVDPVFVDGFESGDTQAWSSTVP
jgi:hypothetical protein